MQRTILILFGLFTLIMCLPVQCNTPPTKTAMLKNPNAKQILTELEKGNDVFLINSTITGDLDFTTLNTAYTASAAIRQYEVAGSLTMVNCVVKGQVIGYHIDKESLKQVVFRKNFSCPGTRFEGKVNLQDAQINGIADFSAAVFDKPVSFEGAVFNSRPQFNKATFYDEARFQGALFMYHATFMDAVFEGVAGFQNVRWYADANFNNTRFLRYADFGNLQCQGDLFFNYAQFAKQAMFNNGRLFGRVEMMSCLFENQLDFSQTLFYGNLKLVNTECKAELLLTDATFLVAKPDVQQLKKKK